MSLKMTCCIADLHILSTYVLSILLSKPLCLKTKAHKSDKGFSDLSTFSGNSNRLLRRSSATVKKRGRLVLTQSEPTTYIRLE